MGEKIKWFKRNMVGLLLLLAVCASLPVYYHIIGADEIWMPFLTAVFVAFIPLGLVGVFQNNKAFVPDRQVATLLARWITALGLIFLAVFAGTMEDTLIAYGVILASALPVWIILSTVQKICLRCEARSVRNTADYPQSEEQPDGEVNATQPSDPTED